LETEPSNHISNEFTFNVLKRKPNYLADADQGLTVEAFPGERVLIASGMPHGIWLLVGPPGVGKSTFCKQFIADGLKVGKNAVYVSTEEAPDSIRKYVHAPDNNQVRVVDCYSWREGGNPDHEYVANPSNLNDVNILLEKSKSGLTQFRYVMDSISSLAISAGLSPVQKFLQISIARLRTVRATGLCVVEQGAQDEKFMNYLRYAFDGVIEMDFMESGSNMGRTIRIFSMRGVNHETTKKMFSIGDNGITIEAR